MSDLCGVATILAARGHLRNVTSLGLARNLPSSYRSSLSNTGRKISHSLPVCAGLGRPLGHSVRRRPSGQYRSHRRGAGCRTTRRPGHQPSGHSREHPGNRRSRAISHAHGDEYSNAHGYTDSHARTDEYAYTYGDEYSNTNAHGYSNIHARTNSYTHSNGDEYSNTNAHGYSNIHARTNSYTHSNADQYPNAYAHGYTDSHARTNGHSHSNADQYSDDHPYPTADEYSDGHPYSNRRRVGAIWGPKLLF